MTSKHSQNPNPQGANRGSRANNPPDSKNGKTVQGPAINTITTSELREHLKGLRGISANASKLFALLGEQITSASHMIPVQRGLEIVKGLGEEAKIHRDRLATTFDPLRDQINQMKAGFLEKHGAKLEEAAQRYIRQKIEERVPVEVKKVLNRYFQYLETSAGEKRELREAIEVSDARLLNSLLRVRYPQEPITWIGDLPTIKLEDLTNADGPSILGFAEFLGLSPAREDDRIKILNSIMRNLGILYRALPSWAGVLLVPTGKNL